MDANTVFKRFWTKITEKTRNFSDLPAPQLSEILEFGQIRGRNGQIHVISGESYEAWLSARGPKPPKIQFYLDQALSWRKRLDQTPALTHSQLGAEEGISRSEVIHTLNLLRLAPEIQRFVRLLPPSPRYCPLTKKKLRALARNRNTVDQVRKFKQMISDLFNRDPIYTNLFAQAVGDDDFISKEQYEVVTNPEKIPDAPAPFFSSDKSSI